MKLPEGLDRLAARQWGLVSRTQALQVLTPDQVRARREAGILVRVHPGVYRLAGAPRSWRQRAMAACLAYGAPAAVSHRAAARLWDLEGVHVEEPEVTVPSGRSGRQRGIATYRCDLPLSDVTSRYDIPVTTPLRTLRDLAGVLPGAVLGRAVDQALRTNLVTPDDLAWLDAHRTGRGFEGSSTLRRLLRTRLAHDGRSDSVWEDRVWQWLVAAGLDPPQRQVQVLVAGTVRILDLAYVAPRVAIEFAGFEWHGQRHRFDSDAARTTELQLQGWLVVTVTSEHSREDVVDRVRRALALRAGNGRAAATTAAGTRGSGGWSLGTAGARRP
jgi:very-short-patch-repair endonuclease